MKKYDNNVETRLEKEMCIPIMHLYYDEKGDEHWAYKCPYCNNFFEAKKKNIDRGSRLSCGCLKIKHSKEMGMANKKKNLLYFPLGSNYGLCFYHNLDDYYIFQERDLPLIDNYTWYGRRRPNGKIDAYTKINGKTVYLTDLLMNTHVKEGQECDHINLEPRDNRECNLRNGTKEMNLLNTERADGVWGEVIEGEDNKFIVRFSKFVSDKVFDTKEEAEKVLSEFNEYIYCHSQQIAREIETNEFNDTFRYFGVLDDIYRLPVKNVYKNWLTRIRVWRQNNQITDEQAGEMYLRLIQDYKDWLKDKAKVASQEG